MAITTSSKAAIVAEYAQSKGDTGSPEVQVAILSERIGALQEHFKSNTKDHHGRRGLLFMVGRRNRLLTYLARTDRERYQNLIKRLGLRK